ncbi:recombinase family protein [Novosphingobium guangzhouense]|uniref:Resolvase/invertase-type recombinase catalytic domain-containing protein n=1 Tax=Novosphingobium guangzhouense TaxID=1850347 RepID=A0A2K2FWY1_9SPHN|nr:recombinase family protein [Novosphingobium guangzhouense]PNU03299.1 hypothetical protein A8V01_06050 [Novosphingobium guangzhouense]
MAADCIYTDKSVTETNRMRAGLDQALATVRDGDTFVVPKLDGFAPSDPGARGEKVQLGARVHSPADPIGKMFVNIRATFAEFEADLTRQRTRSNMPDRYNRSPLDYQQSWPGEREP